MAIPLKTIETDEQGCVWLLRLSQCGYRQLPRSLSLILGAGLGGQERELQIYRSSLRIILKLHSAGYRWTLRTSDMYDEPPNLRATRPREGISTTQGVISLHDLLGYLRQ